MGRGRLLREGRVMPTTTTNYSWNKPAVGGDEDAWGGYLNGNWDSLDTLLGGVTNAQFSVLNGLTATTTELNYVDGVTSAIQPQLDAAATTGKAIAMAIVFG